MQTTKNTTIKISLISSILLGNMLLANDNGGGQKTIIATLKALM
ncbi:hypothetical protein [Helicobacter sp. 23-1046]